MATQTKMVSAKTQAANPTKYSTAQVDPSLTGGTANRPAAPVTPTVEAPKQYNAGGGVISPYNKPITSSAMTPAPSVALPTPATPAATAPVQASVNASNATTTKASEAATAAQANATPTQSDNLSNFMKEQLGIQTEMTDAKASIDRAEQQKQQAIADEYTIQSEQEAQTAKLAIEALQKNNPQGLFGGALQDEVNRINRDSLSQQANLAILQNAALRRYDRAKSIADEQLAMKLEPLKMKLDNLKLFYGENKELLSKADDRAYNELIKTKDREYKKIEDTETQLNEIKKNVAQYAGADAANIISKLSKIDSKSPDAVSKAIALAGKYQSDPLDRAIKSAQLSKLNADISKTRSEVRGAGTQTAGNLRKLDDTEYSKFTSNPNYEAINNGSKYTSALAGFKDTVNKYGTADFSATGQGELNAAYSNLVASTKDYYKLGTLDAGVEKLVSLGVPAPGKFRTRDKKVLSSLDILKGEADKNIENAKQRLGNSVYGDTTEFATLLSSIETPQSEDDYLNTVDQTLSTVNSPYASYLNE